MTYSAKHVTTITLKCDNSVLGGPCRSFTPDETFTASTEAEARNVARAAGWCLPMDGNFWVLEVVCPACAKAIGCPKDENEGPTVRWELDLDVTERIVEGLKAKTGVEVITFD